MALILSSTIELSEFFSRCFPLSVEIEGQIIDVYSSSAFLARFEPGNRELDLAGQHLALKHFRRQVREVVGAHLVDWDDG